jgi:hypothetical protein
MSLCPTGRCCSSMTPEGFASNGMCKVCDVAERTRPDRYTPSWHYRYHTDGLQLVDQVGMVMKTAIDASQTGMNSLHYSSY